MDEVCGYSLDVNDMIIIEASRRPTLVQSLDCNLTLTIKSDIAIPGIRLLNFIDNFNLENPSDERCSHSSVRLFEDSCPLSGEQFNVIIDFEINFKILLVKVNIKVWGVMSKIRAII